MRALNQRESKPQDLAHDLANYYKPVRVGNFWSGNYIECQSNEDRNKTLSIREYLNKIRPYLKDINDPKNLIHGK